MVFTVEERADCLLKYRVPATSGGLFPLLRLLLLTSSIYAALPKAQSSIRWDSEVQLHGGEPDNGEALRKAGGGIRRIRDIYLVNGEAP